LTGIDRIDSIVTRKVGSARAIGCDLVVSAKASTTRISASGGQGAVARLSVLVEVCAKLTGIDRVDSIVTREVGSARAIGCDLEVSGKAITTGICASNGQLVVAGTSVRVEV